MYDLPCKDNNNKKKKLAATTENAIHLSTTDSRTTHWQHPDVERSYLRKRLLGFGFEVSAESPELRLLTPKRVRSLSS